MSLKTANRIMKHLKKDDVHNQSAVVYPAGHKLGMVVPDGGSSCSTCKFLGSDHASCDNRVWVKWNGSATLPVKDESYCCDLYINK